MSETSTDKLAKMFESGEIDEILDTVEDIAFFEIQKRATTLLKALGK